MNLIANRWRSIFLTRFIQSWDTQGAGLGYLIERGFIVEQDLATLLGRTPKQAKKSMNGSEEKGWQGSGLGGDWDDKVGAGAAASSVVSLILFFL